jgi:hypothetical protein
MAYIKDTTMEYGKSKLCHNSTSEEEFSTMAYIKDTTQQHIRGGVFYHGIYQRCNKRIWNF